MTVKLLGSVCILAACGGLGFYYAASQKRDTASLRMILAAIQYLECELKFHQPPLSMLCAGAAKGASGSVAEFFRRLTIELERKSCADVQSCVPQAIRHTANLPPRSAEVLLLLGQSLGKFDLEGQLQGLASVQEYCGKTLSALENGQQQRLRGYQTLGLCAGAALVILFI